MDYFEEIMKDVDQIFQLFFNNNGQMKAVRQGQAFPACDIIKRYVNEKKNIVFEIAVAGYSKNDIEVEVKANSILTVKGARNAESFEGDEYLSRTIKDSFSEVFRIPSEYDTNSASIKLENGLLTIVIPEKEDFTKKLSF
jgi:HSP20 family molecular chaperone IbpA